MKGCATSHTLKWGPLSAYDVGRIPEHVWNGEGRKNRKEGRGGVYTCLFLLPIEPWTAAKKGLG